ncbi:hypothetical protein [Falsiroseomonas oryzae]|uniref:hypothetical protein n=1 Tax=Falsiroseomonas oryzae TaxID=2766473 RepID=UPI0022EB48C6|nr:hypothetical protein [Roseomonas sp. MO-31]
MSSARAASTIYTSPATFFAALNPVTFTKGFSVPNFSFGNGASFSGNGFAFTLNSPGDGRPSRARSRSSSRPSWW